MQLSDLVSLTELARILISAVVLAIAVPAMGRLRSPQSGRRP